MLFAMLALLASIAYVVWHLWRITPAGWPAKLAVSGIFLLWFLLFIAGLAFTENVSVRAATFLYEAGMPWMIAFLYLLLLFALADIGVLCGLLPKRFLSDSARDIIVAPQRPAAG